MLKTGLSFLQSNLMMGPRDFRLYLTPFQLWVKIKTSLCVLAELASSKWLYCCSEDAGRPLICCVKYWNFSMSDRFQKKAWHVCTVSRTLITSIVRSGPMRRRRQEVRLDRKSV